MGTNLAELPLSTARVRASAGRKVPTSALALLAPFAVAIAALAMHYLLPDKQDEPLNWLASVPAWRHPYPLILVGVAALSLLATLLHTTVHSSKSFIRHYAPLMLVPTLAMFIWEFITVKMNWFQLPFFPGPDEVFGAMIEDRMMLASSAWHSLRLLLSGYFAGVIAGVTSGVLIGWFPNVRYWAMPAIKFLGPIPATMLIPLVMTIWKDSFPGAVALIAFSVWFPVTILTSSGIANVRVSYLEVARTLGASQTFLIFRVALPAALPFIFIGLFMGMAVSFLSLIVAENVGVKYGLGWYMTWQRGYFEFAKVYATLIISAAFFSTLMTALFMTRDRVLRWQKGVIKW